MVSSPFLSIFNRNKSESQSVRDCKPPPKLMVLIRARDSDHPQDVMDVDH